jgi:hypothetical protein
MNERLAQFLSVVLHPAIIPSYIVTVVFFAGSVLVPYEFEVKLSLLGLVFATTFIIPATSLLLFYRSGLIGSLHLHDRRERVGPFLVISIFYTITSGFFLIKLPSVPFVPNILATITFVILLVTVITLFFKVSAHSTGVSGMLGTFMALQYAYPGTELFYPILATILLSGALMSARLALNAHSPIEIAVGAVLGFGTCFGGFILAK